MNLEKKLINLLLESPNSDKICSLAKTLEKESNFNIKKDLYTLTGIWELRWSSSSAPFLSYSPLLNNLQILDPINSLGLNLLKPRGINSIIGTGIVAELNPTSEIRIDVKFTFAGLSGEKVTSAIGNLSRIKLLNNFSKKSPI